MYSSMRYENQNDKLPKFRDPVLVCYSLTTDAHTITHYGCAVCMLDNSRNIMWVDVIWGTEITDIFELYWIDFKSCFGNLNPTSNRYK